VKYLSVVDRRFWENERLGSKAATDGLVGATWEATAGQQGGGVLLTAFSGGPAQPFAGGAGLRTEERLTKKPWKPFTRTCGALHCDLLPGLARRPLDASGLLVSGPRTGDGHWAYPALGARAASFCGGTRVL
jgi:hypothetical protein